MGDDTNHASLPHERWSALEDIRLIVTERSREAASKTTAKSGERYPTVDSCVVVLIAVEIRPAFIREGEPGGDEARADFRCKPFAGGRTLRQDQERIPVHSDELL